MELIVKVTHPDFILFKLTEPTEPLPDNQIALRGEDTPVTLEARNWGSVAFYPIRIEFSPPNTPTSARIVLENAQNHPFSNTALQGGEKAQFGIIAEFICR